MLQTGRYFPLITVRSRPTFRILCCLENGNAPSGLAALRSGWKSIFKPEKASGHLANVELARMFAPQARRNCSYAKMIELIADSTI